MRYRHIIVSLSLLPLGVSYEEDSVVVEIFITDTSKFNTWSIEKQSISLCTELAAASNVRFSSITYREHLSQHELYVAYFMKFSVCSSDLSFASL